MSTYGSRFKFKLLLFGLLTSVFMLVALEAGARVAYTIQYDAQHSPTQPWFIYSAVLGWDRRPGFKGVAGGYERTFDARGYFSTDSNQITNTEQKVIVLGDSNTFGYGTPADATFTEVADDLLPGVSMINLGVVGASSYQGRVALSKYLKVIKPSLIVCSYNFNDRRYVLTRAEADSAEQFQRVWSASTGPRAMLSKFLSTSYLCRGINSALRILGLLGEEPRTVDLSKVVPRVDETSYRQNLEEIAKETRKDDIPLVFILLKDNPLQTELLDQGIERLSGHDYAAAISALKAAVESENMFSDLARLYLAK